MELDQTLLAICLRAPEGACVTCFRPGERGGFPLEAGGRLFWFCGDCLKHSTDLEPMPITRETVRVEIIQAHSVECCVCSRRGPTTICPGLCGRSFHWSCRRNSRCSSCVEDTRVV